MPNSNIVARDHSDDIVAAFAFNKHIMDNFGLSSGIFHCDNFANDERRGKSIWMLVHLYGLHRQFGSIYIRLKVLHILHFLRMAAIRLDVVTSNTQVDKKFSVDLFCHSVSNNTNMCTG